MRYTVKQLATLAGVTNRALHYYDEIGLLHPESVGENGYRYYGEEAALRLQQILFYRELDFPLDQIKALLDRPDFDLLQTLEGHRRALNQRVERINRLIETVDHTIKHLQGEYQMSTQDFYSGFDEEKQKKLAEEAQNLWGESVVQTQKRWESYSREKKNAVLAENHAITNGVAAAMDQGPESPEVQQWIERWYRSINENFYTCSLEMFEALGHGYVEDERFSATYEKVKPGLAAFMDKAMTYYCKVNRK